MAHQIWLGAFAYISLWEPPSRLLPSLLTHATVNICTLTFGQVGSLSSKAVMLPTDAWSLFSKGRAPVSAIRPFSDPSTHSGFEG